MLIVEVGFLHDMVTCKFKRRIMISSSSLNLAGARAGFSNKAVSVICATLGG